MYKVISFLTKKDGLSLAQFREYYENHHIPLVLSLAAPPLLYKRRYIERGEPLTSKDSAVDFDVIVELVFKDEHSFKTEWMVPLCASEQSHLISADEENFLDRPRTRAYIFDESVTSGSVVESLG